jgi:hypothetical protein
VKIKETLQFNAVELSVSHSERSSGRQKLKIITASDVRPHFSEYLKLL